MPLPTLKAQSRITMASGEVLRATSPSAILKLTLEAQESMMCGAVRVFRATPRAICTPCGQCASPSRPGPKSCPKVSGKAVC